MPTDTEIVVQDLRGSAREQKREADTKSKWEPKWAVGGAAPFRLSTTGKKRPARRCSQKFQALDRKQNEKTIHRMSLTRKQYALDAPVAEDDSSEDESTSDGSATRSFEDHVDYSYDARGPSSGSQVLGDALTIAVDRFESRLTEKLIREEYEVLEANCEFHEIELPSLLDEDGGFELI